MTDFIVDTVKLDKNKFVVDDELFNMQVKCPLCARNKNITVLIDRKKFKCESCEVVFKFNVVSRK